MIVEYRAWIDVPGLPVADEADWQRLMDRLEESHGELGPVGSWEQPDTLTVVLSTDADTPVAAARELVDAVLDSLQAAGMSEKVPTAMRLEPVTEDAPAPATTTS